MGILCKIEKVLKRKIEAYPFISMIIAEIISIIILVTAFSIIIKLMVRYNVL